ncbi:uncharacterized protein GIQ15_05970 [Arthroderma uncinatum]|uniref:uncharacterized protein n=1 Tax=Arthroderma uncinatum TaxID=74035 RepID=UPI00144AE95A|nr:uncharacterized protein GIQ15_05970 [Arthroderma uncinatum]KAF3480623.1 hypothetical protein GIQ15_05970 [Arthroderma uncinatum]
MTLKRKASFSTILSPRSSTSFYDHNVSPIPCSLDDAMVIDETPQHLHSRTRKRFRNDRPDEQAVYDNTLRWLFSAQKHIDNTEVHPMASTSNDDGPDEAEPSTPSLADSVASSMKPDPSQRTLHHFFRPASAPARVSSSDGHTGSNTNTTLSTPTNAASQASSSRTSSSIWSADASASLSPNPSAGAGPGVNAGESDDVDMDMGVETFTASATALTPAYQQRAWMDGKDMTPPVRCYYLLS